MILLGVGHRAESGKSTFCATIIEQCSRIGISCGEYSIGDAVLEYCIREGLLPKLRRDELHNGQIETLARVGYEKRKENADFWLDQVHTRISAEHPKVVLVPNVRYANEARWAKDLGGHTVLVERFNGDGTRFISETRNPNHPSETGLAFWPWDFRIANIPNRPYWLRRQATALLEYLRDGAE